MQKERELKIRKWFSMWIDKNCEGIEDLFCQGAVYVESWGPKYTGINAIKHWFEEWNTRGSVKTWDIKQFFHKDDFFIKCGNCYFRLTDFQHLLVDGCFDSCYNQGTIKSKEL